METALSGVRILDLSRFVAGPFATSILANLGAEVIKVEPPQGRPPPSQTFMGEEAYSLTINLGKKSLALDLNKEQGKQIFMELVKRGDVVHDNFRPGVMEKLGLDYERLKAVNPRIISCSVRGFASQGRYRDRPAFDLIIQAIGGAMSLTGYGDGPPAVCGVAVADYGTAMFAAHGILAALYAREKTGVGQRIEVSMLASQLALMVESGADYLLCGTVDGPSGGGEGIFNTSHPYGTFRSRDGYIAVAGMRHFEGFCRAIGKPEWLHDPRFSTPEKRRQNRELLSLIQEVMASKTTAEWEELFLNNDVPFSRVNNLEEAFNHPAVQDEEIVVNADFRGEKIRVLGNPIRLSATPSTTRQRFGSPPRWGEHTDRVLSQLLGYSEERLAQLKGEKVIFGPAAS